MFGGVSELLGFYPTPYIITLFLYHLLFFALHIGLLGQSPSGEKIALKKKNNFENH